MKLIKKAVLVSLGLLITTSWCWGAANPPVEKLQSELADLQKTMVGLQKGLGSLSDSLTTLQLKLGGDGDKAATKKIVYLNCSNKCESEIDHDKSQIVYYKEKPYAELLVEMQSKASNNNDELYILDLSGRTDLSNDQVNNVITTIKDKLVSLILTNCYCSVANCKGQLLHSDQTGCKGLRELSTFQHLFPSLETLDLSGCKTLSTMPNLKNCPKIKSLNFTDCESLDKLKVEEGWIAWAKRQIDKARTFTLNDGHPIRECLPESLEEIYFNNWKELTIDDVVLICKNKNLKKIDLQGSSVVVDNKWEDLKKRLGQDWIQSGGLAILTKNAGENRSLAAKILSSIVGGFRKITKQPASTTE